MMRVERWERRTERLLASLAVVSLVAYAWPILEPSMSLGLRRAFDQINLAI